MQTIIWFQVTNNDNYDKDIRKKLKRTEDSDTDNKNIEPEYRNGMWHWKICHSHDEKREKRETVEGIELPYQESIRAVGEKENYKYLGILEADTITNKLRGRKNKKREPQKDKKASWNQDLQ